MAGQTKQRACGHKLRHTSLTNARKQIADLRDNLGASPDQYRAYVCPHCGFWHVGHRVNRRRK